jgi:arylsulfatase A-like enzyme
MDRRIFVKSLLTAPAAMSGAFARDSARRTEHLIFIVPDGLRKTEYRGRTSLMPNLERLAFEGFVFEEDHCEQVASHDAAFGELLRGRPMDSASTTYPTILDYVGNGFHLNRIEEIPTALQQSRPRLIVCRLQALEAGHVNYGLYRNAVRSMDRALGTLFDWVKGHPHFSGNTAIVLRPEFGRDDVVNDEGQLHHSYGFYFTHRVASVFWGPDFDRGVDQKTIVTSLDMAPTLTKLFSVDAIHARGRVIPGLIKSIPS